MSIDHDKGNTSGAVRPEDILADGIERADFAGVSVRKGTVAAFLHNAVRWSNPAISESDRDAIGREIKAAVPALEALRLFEVFDIKNERLRALISDHTLRSE